MLRAAIVMAVATLDAFVRDLLIELLPKALESPNLDFSGLNDYLSRDDARAIASSADPTTQRMTLLRDRLGDESAQSPSSISKLVKLIGRDPDEMWQCLGSPQTELAAVASRRHQIAHRNDVPQGRSRAQSIRRAWVERQVEFLIDFGRNLHDDLRVHVHRL